MKQDRVITKWLIFGRLDFPDRKTQVWQVTSVKGILLGDIKWFSRWRCYAFFPAEKTVFNSECLENIKDFIDMLMKNRNDILMIKKTGGD